MKKRIGALLAGIMMLGMLIPNIALADNNQTKDKVNNVVIVQPFSIDPDTGEPW